MKIYNKDTVNYNNGLKYVELNPLVIQSKLIRCNLCCTSHPFCVDTQTEQIHILVATCCPQPLYQVGLKQALFTFTIQQLVCSLIIFLRLSVVIVHKSNVSITARKAKGLQQQRDNDKNGTSVRNQHDKHSDLYGPIPSIGFIQRSVVRVQQDKQRSEIVVNIRSDDLFKIIQMHIMVLFVQNSLCLTKNLYLYKKITKICVQKN